MTTATGARPGPTAARTTLPLKGLDLALGVLPLIAVSAASCRLLALPTSHVLQTAALYVLLGALVLRHLPAPERGPGIGPANRVTLLRATFVLPLAALAPRPGPLLELGYWWVLTLATAAMILDGVDGEVARRTGSDSAFGARFDMELDAVLLLALSGLLWQSGKAGAWVLLIGALRYLFVLGGLVWPQLGRELPESVRRKTVCVVQGGALMVALAPITSPAVAAGVAAGALLLLAYSFAVDVWWLAATRDRGRYPRGPRGGTGLPRPTGAPSDAPARGAPQSP